MNLLKLGVVLVFVGMILAVIATFLQALGGISVSGGGCIVVGFIPVCFGVGEHALPAIMIVLVLAIALVVISLLFMTYAHRRIKETIPHGVAI
ncbi:MAG: hypothetical protein QXH02_03315 [Desulfurococcaceae archaeon]